MFYHGGFKSINNIEYDVQIISGNDTEEFPITLSGDPVIITGSSDGIFAPIKSRSCSITFLSTDYHIDLYNPKQRETTVKITDTTNNKVVFRGFVTPCEYNQDYTYIDDITLECIDGISSSKDYKWTNNNQYNSFLDILLSILKPCGYRGYLFVPRSYTKVNNTTINTTSTGRDILDLLTCSSNNFIDDDEQKTPWTEYEVVQEIMRFIGLSLVPDGDDVYLVDYKALNAATIVNYTKYNIQTGVQARYEAINNNIIVSSAIEATGKPNFSIDDIYNKIEISDNLYEVKDITTDIFDDENHISVTTESALGVNGVQWTKTHTKEFLWWSSSTTEITGYDYQTFCRLKPESGWTHKYFKHNDLSPVNDYHDSSSDSLYKKNINGVVNTQCCLIQHYAHVKEEGGNHLPASLDWTDVLTFFVVDDTTPTFTVGPTDDSSDRPSIYQLEKDVLEYNITENIQWKPASGTSWITIKGDLFYQYNGAKYGEKNRDTLNIVNKDKQYYHTAPVDKSINIDAQPYIMLGRGKNESGYREGFSCWKMRLQIGDKYWAGDSWTTIPSDFYIKYNNGPTDGETETVEAFSWMSPVNNNDYKDKVGVDGYAIPIRSDLPNDPNNGPLKLTIYTPALIPVELFEKFRQIFPNFYLQCSGLDLSPCIYVKDFELGYVYTDTDVWWNNHDDKNENDKVYVGYIDEDYVNDFDGLEFKLNTAIKERPISKSYVCLSSGGYLDKLKHKYSDESKTQEYNIIDLYLDHYGDKKVIYEANLHGLYRPVDRFTFTNVYKLSGNFLVDTQSIDLKNDNNRIKLIQY